ncbi:MAG: aminopeptidase P family protein [Rhodobacteraceae bacterium]|nr:aminopeptidase P family protein [Paracoccaceae bacterium]
MFQNFTVTSSPETGAARLAKLRDVLKAKGFDGFLVPRADAHQGENVAPCDERLAWLTGFTGSAGSCAVLIHKAGVFIDGRYRIQVKSQIDLACYTPVHWPETKVADWLVENLPKGGVVAFDPMLHSYDEIETLSKTLDPAGIKLHRSENLVDQIWADQPKPPQAGITPYPIEFSGLGSNEKRADIARSLVQNNLDAFVLTLPESIAWLLNIRGNDVANTPVALCFAVLKPDASLDLFVDPAKVNPALIDHLGPEISLHDSPDLKGFLQSMTGNIGVDRMTAPVWVSDRITHSDSATKTAKRVWFDDPCILPKACKNPTELAGARSAHLRDAVAMVEFLRWVDETVPQAGITEIDVAKKLESLRQKTNALRDISFETISASGPNGAICHYRVDEDSNRIINNPDLLLVDSGGQYLDGTTDITRTIPIGPPSEDMCKMFTLVLKGMISISMLRWPEGRAGRDIDAFARAALWQQGFDYDHGTGHGVGAYLGVHEGPARISSQSDVPILPGMILSNEPGYYRENQWGIRIENLLIVLPPDIPASGDRKMLGFETITWVPIDRRLIEPKLLNAAELNWINTYHQQVLEKLGPMLAGKTLAWLQAACQPVAL